MRTALFLCVGIVLMAVCFGPSVSTLAAEESGVCMATVDCDDGSKVSCTGQSSCLITDDACPDERGSVTCDGVTTSCPRCSCPVEGEICFDGSDCRPAGVRPCALCVCIAQYPYPGFCGCP